MRDGWHMQAHAHAHAQAQQQAEEQAHGLAAQANVHAAAQAQAEQAVSRIKHSMQNGAPPPSHSSVRDPQRKKRTSSVNKCTGHISHVSTKP